MALPAAFLDHLRTKGYHSRSNKHSNALAIAVVEDLVSACAALARHAIKGEATFDLNFNVHAQTTVWNTDLVIGRPPSPVVPTNDTMTRARPATIEIALELKSIMTEHRKQVKNRKRDLEAHHANVHNHRDSVIAAGLFVVNQASTFKSPLRTTLTRHGKDRMAVAALVQHCIAEMRSVTERQRPGDVGMDAKCVIVVDMDNVNLADTAFVDKPPAPLTGDPLNYDSFIQRICEQYTARFGA